MSEFASRQIKYVFGPETIRNEGTSADMIGSFEWIDGGYQDKIENEERTGSLGSTNGVSDTVKTEEYAMGTFGGDLHINSVSSILYSLLGAKTSIETAGVFTHEMKYLELNTHPTLALGKLSPLKNELFKGAVVESFEITSEVGSGTVNISFNIQSKSGEEDNTLSTTYSEDFKLHPKDGIFKIASNYSGLDSADTKCLRSMKLTFTPDISRRQCLGSLQPSNILIGEYKITGTIEFDYSDDIVTDMVKNNDKKAIQFGLFDTDIDLLGTGLNPTLDFKFYRVGFTSSETNESLGDTVTQSVNFTAFHDYSEEETLTCTLINTLDF